MPGFEPTYRRLLHGDGFLDRVQQPIAQDAGLRLDQRQGWKISWQ